MKNSSRRLCAIVPAAGRGTRLGAEVPKVFVPILPDVTIWDAIREKMAGLAETIVLVLSPDGQRYVDAHAELNFEKTHIALQAEPLGMGDAIFGAADFWNGYDDLLIIWGDQFNVATETLRACVELHGQARGPAVTLPVVRTPRPYVEYVFASGGRLTEVRQSREGDVCAANGFSDMGVFLLTGGSALVDEWRRYRETKAAGVRTGEVNFLPFLVYLSSTAGWPVGRYESADPAEAVGINTPEELAFAREVLQKKAAAKKSS